jgi:hypothetical protein
MRSKRGSAYIYVLLMVISISVVAVAIADSAVTYYKNQARAEQSAQAAYLLAGAIEEIEARRVWTRIDVPSATTASIHGALVSLSIDSGDTARSMKVTASTTVAGKTHKQIVYTGRSRPTPFYFGLAVDTALSSVKRVQVGNTLGNRKRLAQQRQHLNLWRYRGHGHYLWHCLGLGREISKHHVGHHLHPKPSAGLPVSGSH